MKQKKISVILPMPFSYILVSEERVGLTKSKHTQHTKWDQIKWSISALEKMYTYKVWKSQSSKSFQVNDFSATSRQTKIESKTDIRKCETLQTKEGHLDLKTVQHSFYHSTCWYG